MQRGAHKHTEPASREAVPASASSVRESVMQREALARLVRGEDSTRGLLAAWGACSPTAGRFSRILNPQRPP